MPTNVNTIVNTLIKLKGTSQSNLSSKLGISRTHLNRFLNSEADLSSQKFISLLNVLDINIADIITNEVNKILGSTNKSKSLGESIEYVLSSLRPNSRKAILIQLLSSIDESRSKQLHYDIKSIKSDIKSTRTLRGTNA